MTERKHTPGPWTRNGNDILVGANGEPIVLAGSRLALGADRGDGERIANNALVESAPQLLADLDTARSEVARLTAEVEARNGELAAIWAIANETSPDDAPDPMPAWSARNAVDALEDRWHAALRGRDEAFDLLAKARKWIGVAPAEWPNEEVIEIKRALDALRARKVGG